ncbi:hypothetical protein AVEN_254704-1 [Araneus ventricosus]|uniref:Uncharacterized protein n=1 Tax=Araneus ventricosus TaxID=182803 RepID=A0A4Y2K4T9_ARAVE|nr:hypothetical protein AVEN_254704-1 [Araneus ventricosus]
MFAEALVPSINQSIETSIEEIRIQDAEPFNDGFLNFGIGSEMATCQVFFNCLKRLVHDPGCMFHYIPSETLNQIRVIEAECGRALSCSNRAPFENSPSRFL